MFEIVASLITGLLVSLVLSPIAIPFLKRLKFGQMIREEGPQSHQAKSGTPTMGGVVIVIAALAGGIAFAEKNNEFLIITVSFLGFGMIGFIDDYIKVVLKRNLGLRAWQKIVMQLGISVFLAVFSYNVVGTDILVPFTRNYIDFGVIYVPFMVFVILAFVNAVNLTDGLDGLASGVSIFSFSVFIAMGLLFSQAAVSIFAASLIGGLIGFLKVNYHPAKVFMGDTGSMALGGALSALLLITKSPLVMLIAGGVFVAEALSVVMQVLYFKATKGKRIFKMTPIHHHFELSGWDEVKVVNRFWMVSAVLAFFGIMSLL